MLSEYEQNLIKEIEGPPGSLLTGRRARKWSLVRQASSLFNQGRKISFFVPKKKRRPYNVK